MTHAVNPKIGDRDYVRSNAPQRPVILPDGSECFV